MNEEFINLSEENLEQEHLCCIIRTKTKNIGVERKREWLRSRLKEGHIFRKLNQKATVFIEYAPLEFAWTPIVGDNYIYIYCLWVSGDYKGKGYGKQLLEYAITDAKNKGKSGICLLGSEKQKAWLTDQNFAQKYGFKVVDSTDNGFQLYALSFDGTYPKFAESAKKMKIENKGLTIFYDDQCPYIQNSIKMVQKFCEEKSVPLNLEYVDSLEKAKNLPSVFNNFCVFYNGKFQTVNLIDVNTLKRIIKGDK